ncbi:MAG: hypothetical protein IJW17_01895 [Lentisphaeria bacterium]|nr:hypothetical protein [Lentisphaeria bacterium]
MRYLSLFLTGIVLSLSAAENLIPDGGLELEGHDWTVVRFADANRPETLKYLPAAADKTDKVEGQQSLRIDNPGKQPVGFRTPEFRVGSDRYTFSFYAKSSKPVTVRVLFMAIGDLTGEKRKKSWDNVTYRYLTLGREWKRYTLSFKRRDPRFHFYYVDFMWGKNKDNDASVWFDAIQLEKGEQASTFTPHAPVEAVLFARDHHRREGMAQLDFTLKAVNHTNTPQTKTFLLTEKNDSTGEVVKKHSIILNIPAKTTAAADLKTSGNKFGIYSVSGKEVLPLLYCYSKKYHPRKVELNKGFAFGTELFGGYSVPDVNGGKRELRLLYTDHDNYKKFCDTQGYQLIRVGNGERFLDWRFLEPQPGKFDFSKGDAVIRDLAERNYQLLGVLGSLMLERSYPQWVIDKSTFGSRKYSVSGQRAAYPPLPEFRRYVRETVRHYQKEIRYWEIFNEPNLTCPGREFVAYMKAAWEEIKKIDPALVVVGPNVTGDLGGQMREFLDDFGQAGGFKYTDILSFHPYSSREEYSPYPADQAIRDIFALLKKYNAPHLPLWNTELYYIKQHPPYYFQQGEYETWRFIRRLLIDLGENVKLSALLEDNEMLRNDRHFNNLWSSYRVQRKLVPSGEYAAGCAFADRFAGAVPLRRVRPFRGVTAYFYKLHNGRAAGAVWKYFPEQQGSIFIPDDCKLRFYDIFGNPAAVKQKYAVTEEPLIFEADSPAELEKEFARLKLLPAVPCHAAGGRYWADPRGTYVAVELQNLSDGELKLRARVSIPDAGSSKAIDLVLAAQEKRVVLLPITLKKADFAPAASGQIILFDGRQVFKFPLQLAQMRLPGAGKVNKFGDAVFSVERKGERVFFDITVKDNTIGKRSADQWMDDCVEFFFDTCPLKEPSRRRYTAAGQFRLFVRPEAQNGKADISSIGKVDLTQVRWSAERINGGYQVKLSLPLPEGSSFDLSTDNSTPVRVQYHWSSKEFSYLYRDGFSAI